MGPVPAKGGHGGTCREYHVSSLPDETRAALLTVAIAAPVLSPAEISAWLSSRRITISPRELEDPKVAVRVSVARAMEACPAYSGREEVVNKLAITYGVSPATIRRWHASIVTAAARRQSRIQVGEERIEVPGSSAFDPPALAFGLAFYARNMVAGMKTAFREMEAAASANAWRIGDYSNFTRIAHKVPSVLWTRVRSGPIGTELSCLPKIIRAWTAVPVQSVLCGDQKIFDYYTTLPAGEVVVPEGYFFMDCSSRMISGVAFELGHYNSFTVGASLQEALAFGMPDEIFTDWGKPEGSKHIAHILKGLAGFSQASDFVDMAAKYAEVSFEGGQSSRSDAFGGLSLQFDTDPYHRKARAQHPWDKPIENIMNLLDTRLKGKSIPGFRKRAKDAWENKEIQTYVRKQAAAGALLPVRDFIQVVLACVDEHNKAEKSLAEGGKIVPADFFTSGLRAAPRVTLDERTVAYICLPAFERIPRQSTVHVKIRGEQRAYFSRALADCHTPVQVSVDPYDAEAPAVLTTPDGDFLDMASPWHVQDPYDTEGLAAKREAQASLMKWIRDATSRLRSGFDLAPPIPAVNKAAHVARRAESGRKVYELQKGEKRKYDAARAKEGDAARARLVAEFEAAQTVVPITTAPAAFTVPDDFKDRFRLWLSLDASLTAGEPLNPEEAQFHEIYQRSWDFRTHKMLYEDFGEMYLPGVNSSHKGD